MSCPEAEVSFREGRHPLSVEASGDREVVMTRVFDAPPSKLFDALTNPELITRWCRPPGWSMPVCEVDLKVNGCFRYVWRKDDTDMGLGGVFREIERPTRLVHTEKFDKAWYPGEALITSTLTADDGRSGGTCSGRTNFRATLQYETQEARDQVLKSEMRKGVALNYNRLDEVLASLA